jgi:predicted RNase H-related nuclease YkuK (DUF458 family)
MKTINEDEIKAVLDNCNLDTKIFFGADSEVVKIDGKKFFDVTVVIAIHIDGCHGCKVFAEITRHKDQDNIAGKPFTRMMKEAECVTELHTRFKDLFYDYEISIHLDINPKKTAGSSIAMEAARGYVKAMTQVEPELKPLAWAGSYAADRARDLGLC